MPKKFLFSAGITVSLVSAILLGTAMPVSAATTTKTTASTAAKTTVHIVQGQVTRALNNGAFTIADGNNTSIVIKVNTATKYYIVEMDKAQADITDRIAAAKKQKANAKKSDADILKALKIPADWKNDFDWLSQYEKTAASTDVETGDRTVSKIDSTNLASVVLIIKGPVTHKVNGTVEVSQNPKTITITTADGKIGPLTWDSSTQFILKGKGTVPAKQYGVVTYNSATKTVQVVDFSVQLPTLKPVTTTKTAAVIKK